MAPYASVDEVKRRGAAWRGVARRGAERRPFLRRPLILHTRQNGGNGGWKAGVLEAAGREEVERQAAGYDSLAIRHDLNLQFLQPPSLRPSGDTHDHVYHPLGLTPRSTSRIEHAPGIPPTMYIPAFPYNLLPNHHPTRPLLAFKRAAISTATLNTASSRRDRALSRYPRTR